MHRPQDDEIFTRFTTATKVIREAGALALSWFGRLPTLKIETKSGSQDVVTIADRDVELLVRERLSVAFPQDGFLGEEFGLSQGSSGFTWVIDPIDGTSCFLHGLRNWCVVIALVKDTETAAGLIFDPNADELFSAIAGRGAALNDAAIVVDHATTLGRGLTSVGANGRVPPRRIAVFVRRLLEEGGMFVRNGSGALSLAHVACGRLAAYYEPHMNVWDCLAGQCLIREAGGYANDVLAEGDMLRGGRVIGCAPQLRAPLMALIETSNAEAAA
ncbi:MAG: inositol monophosphatase family protein [Rhizobiaceae bacterium]